MTDLTLAMQTMMDDGRSTPSDDPLVPSAAQSPASSGAAPAQSYGVVGASTSYESPSSSPSPMSTGPAMMMTTTTSEKSVSAEDAMAGWVTATDPQSGKTYYYNESTRQTSWTPPPPTAAASPAENAAATAAPSAIIDAVDDAQLKTLLMSALLAIKSKAPGGSGWYCVDEVTGQPKGPYTHTQMHQWFAAGYLKDSLELRYGDSGVYLPLDHLFDLTLTSKDSDSGEGSKKLRNPFGLDAASDLSAARDALISRGYGH